MVYILQCDRSLSSVCQTGRDTTCDASHVDRSGPSNVHELLSAHERAARGRRGRVVCLLQRPDDSNCFPSRDVRKKGANWDRKTNSGQPEPRGFDCPVQTRSYFGLCFAALLLLGIAAGVACGVDASASAVVTGLSSLARSAKGSGARQARPCPPCPLHRHEHRGSRRCCPAGLPTLLPRWSRGAECAPAATRAPRLI